eukprot:355094-Chlamydomonas_euryale.AAC.11
MACEVARPHKCGRHLLRKNGPGQYIRVREEGWPPQEGVEVEMRSSGLTHNRSCKGQPWCGATQKTLQQHAEVNPDGKCRQGGGEEGKEGRGTGRLCAKTRMAEICACGHALQQHQRHGVRPSGAPASGASPCRAPPLPAPHQTQFTPPT